MIDIKLPRSVERSWKRAIKNGMAFLDEYFGNTDWVDQIDLNTLDLNDASSCVCGQLFGSHAEALHAQGKYSADSMNGYEYALRHVLENGVPAEQRAKDCGFLLKNDDPDFVASATDRIARYNGFEDEFDMEVETEYEITAYGLFTEMWVEALRGRQVKA